MTKVLAESLKIRAFLYRMLAASLIFVLHFNNPTICQGQSPNLSVTPSRLFIKESAPVLFSFGPWASKEGVPDLRELDEGGHLLKGYGSLHDDGLQGDAVSGDGIFSRVIPISDKRPIHRKFAVYRGTTLLASVEVVIMGHPSFISAAIEALRKVF